MWNVSLKSIFVENRGEKCKKKILRSVWSCVWKTEIENEKKSLNDH